MAADSSSFLQLYRFSNKIYETGHSGQLHANGVNFAKKSVMKSIVCKNNNSKSHWTVISGSFWQMCKLNLTNK
jgi:hypothetical protein